MKSTRRHELETNELADRLGHWVEKVRPHLTTIGLVILAVFVVIGVWYYWVSNQRALAAQAWRTYMFAASDPQGNMVETLSSVSDNFAETQAGLWATLTEADIKASQGVRLLFQDKATAETTLDEAVKVYKDLLDRKLIEDSPMVARRAHFGLAQALEATGDLDGALAHYRRVSEVAPGSAVAETAEQGATRLSKEGTQKWYGWLAKQEPVDRKPPSDLSSGGALEAPAFDLGTVPEKPSADFMEEEPEAKAPDSTSPLAPSSPTDNGPASDEEPEGKETAPLKQLKLNAPPAETPESKPESAEPPESASPPAGGKSGDEP